MTNVAPDHLDWHGTFEHYRDAKAKIASRQTRGELYLYPATQPELAAFAPDDGPDRLPFGAEPRVRRRGVRGRRRDRRPARRRALRAPGAATLDGARTALRCRRGRGRGRDVLRSASTRMRSQRALRAFTFDSHRLEPVGSRDGVRVVDDSVATNTHATLAALRTFDVTRRPDRRRAEQGHRPRPPARTSPDACGASSPSARLRRTSHGSSTGRWAWTGRLCSLESRRPCVRL